MSQSHKNYWSKVHQQQANSGMTMDEFLGNNKDLDIKGYIKSLMQKEGLLYRVKEIIREEIKKLIFSNKLAEDKNVYWYYDFIFRSFPPNHSDNHLESFY